MNLNIKVKIIRFLLILTLLLMTGTAFASEFYFETKNNSVSVGEEFKVDLYIDTQKENINAVEGRIVLPIGSAEFVRSEINDSTINFWIDKPIYNNGVLVFSGITPGGFISEKAKILSFILNTNKEGELIVKIENASALKNDGNGTKTKVNFSNIKIKSFGFQNNNQNVGQNIDLTIPEEFKPEISRDQNIFDNKWFIAFVASDKGSGVEKYEIKESRNNVFDFTKWNIAESPYLLLDQDLKSNIFVKAIDKFGNERIIKLLATNPIPWYTKIDNWFIILIVVLALLQYIFCNRNNK